MSLRAAFPVGGSASDKRILKIDKGKEGNILVRGYFKSNNGFLNTHICFHHYIILLPHLS